MKYICRCFFSAENVPPFNDCEECKMKSGNRIPIEIVDLILMYKNYFDFYPKPFDFMSSLFLFEKKIFRKLYLEFLHIDKLDHPKKIPRYNEIIYGIIMQPFSEFQLKISNLRIDIKNKSSTKQLIPFLGCGILYPRCTKLEIVSKSEHPFYIVSLSGETEQYQVPFQQYLKECNGSSLILLAMMLQNNKKEIPDTFSYHLNDIPNIKEIERTYYLNDNFEFNPNRLSVFYDTDQIYFDYWTNESSFFKDHLNFYKRVVVEPKLINQLK